jgi:single-strand selective monofunctional uracil DNA glycosylase
MASPIAQKMMTCAQELGQACDQLTFPPPVSWVYNPLDYGWNAHAHYLQCFASHRKKYLFVGMNPGPFGMLQTAVPFGEIAVVRDWLGIEEIQQSPSRVHPKRPIQGFACTRSEVSGKRLWGLFRERFGKATAFFKDHFVLNYCPLAFLESSGRNLTPDKLPRECRQQLQAICQHHLQEVIGILKPKGIVGVGRFAFDQCQEAAQATQVAVAQILHPSPASPAANRDWSGQATRQLMEAGVW